MPHRLALVWIVLAVAPAGVGADEPRFLWVTNGPEGTVSKLDAATGAEVARYATVTHAEIVDLMGVGAGALLPWGPVHQPMSAAQDFYGNAWVANAAFGEQPSATRIMNHPPNCFDRNDNDQIDTSRDVNGTPGIQLADPTEFFGEQDECLAFTVIVGVDGGFPMTLAVDAGTTPVDPGNVWVGFRLEQAYYQLDGDTGALIRRVPPTGPSGYRPFRTAIDGAGRLWAALECCTRPQLWRIETATGDHTVTPQAPVYACSGTFDVAVDLAGKVWVAGFPCGAAIRWNPTDSTWFEAQITGRYDTGGGAGIAVGLDGNLWLSLRGGAIGEFARIDPTSGVATGVWGGGGGGPYGVAIDSSGDVWTVNGDSDDVARLHLDPVTRDPAPHPDTGNTVDLFPVGDSGEASGDFSGNALRTITRPDPPGLIFRDGLYSGATTAWSAAVP